MTDSTVKSCSVGTNVAGHEASASACSLQNDGRPAANVCRHQSCRPLHTVVGGTSLHMPRPAAKCREQGAQVDGGEQQSGNLTVRQSPLMQRSQSTCHKKVSRAAQEEEDEAPREPRPSVEKAWEELCGSIAALQAFVEDHDLPCTPDAGASRARLP